MGAYGFFLHRFRHVYFDGGLLPLKVFKIRSRTNSMCMQRIGDRFQMSRCTDASWFHLANQDAQKKWKCCSGIRQWNAMECFDRLDPKGPLAYWCDVTGKNDNQQYHWEPSDIIRHPLTQQCLS